jgi:hypothetical protein
LEYQAVSTKHKKIGLTIFKEWITLDSLHTPSTTNLEEEEIVDAQETMATRRCRNGSNDLIHGGI